MNFRKTKPVAICALLTLVMNSGVPAIAGNSELPPQYEQEASGTAKSNSNSDSFLVCTGGGESSSFAGSNDIELQRIPPTNTGVEHEPAPRPCFRCVPFWKHDGRELKRFLKKATVPGLFAAGTAVSFTGAYVCISNIIDYNQKLSGTQNSLQVESSNLRFACRASDAWQKACGGVAPNACENTDFAGPWSSGMVSWIIDPCGQWNDLEVCGIFYVPDGPCKTQSSISVLFKVCPNLGAYENMTQSAEFQACEKATNGYPSAKIAGYIAGAFFSSLGAVAIPITGTVLYSCGCLQTNPRH